jgi:hypothetical protein
MNFFNQKLHFIYITINHDFLLGGILLMLFDIVTSSILFISVKYVFSSYKKQNYKILLGQITYSLLILLNTIMK